ncbi:hypothetical protein FACS1894105_06600 [Clostridia bacterium]|nr:hypothetical protein FACS1894105_06600 [Clostridia bacterium]
MYTQSSKRFRAIIALILAVAITASTTMIVTAISWGGNTSDTPAIVDANNDGIPDSSDWVRFEPEDGTNHTLNATIWDQREDNIVMSSTIRSAIGTQFVKTSDTGAAKGLVTSTLGKDGKPVVSNTTFGGTGTTNQANHKGVWGAVSDGTTVEGTSSKNSPFYRWFNVAYLHADGVIDGKSTRNASDTTAEKDPIQLSKQLEKSTVNFNYDSTTGVYTAEYITNQAQGTDNTGYFGANSEITGFSNGDSTGKYNQNHYFTMTTGSTFLFEGKPLSFTFTGDDDVWLYIGNKLVLDLGGIHHALSATVSIDKDGYVTVGNISGTNTSGAASGLMSGGKSTLKLTKDEQYDWKLFYAERCPDESNLKIQTTMFAKSNVVKTAQAVNAAGVAVTEGSNDTAGYDYTVAVTNSHDTNTLTILKLVDWMNYTNTTSSRYNSSGAFVDFHKVNGSVGNLYFGTNATAAFPSSAWEKVDVAADGTVLLNGEQITVPPAGTTYYFKYHFDTYHLSPTEVDGKNYVFNQFALLSKTGSVDQAKFGATNVTVVLPEAKAYDIYYWYDAISRNESGQFIADDAFYHESEAKLPSENYPIIPKTDGANITGFNSTQYYATNPTVTNDNGTGKVNGNWIVTDDPAKNIIHVVFAPMPQYTVNYYYEGTDDNILIHSVTEYGEVTSPNLTAIPKVVTAAEVTALKREADRNDSFVFNTNYYTTDPTVTNGTSGGFITATSANNIVNVVFRSFPGYTVNYYYDEVDEDNLITSKSIRAEKDAIIELSTIALDITDWNTTDNGYDGGSFDDVNYDTTGVIVSPDTDLIVTENTAANVINVVFPPLPTYTVNYRYGSLSGTIFHTETGRGVPGTDFITHKTDASALATALADESKVFNPAYYTNAQSAYLNDVEITVGDPQAITEPTSGKYNTVDVVFEARPLITVTASKTWDDADDQDGLRANISFYLKADGTMVPGSTKGLAKDNGSESWSATNGFNLYRYSDTVKSANMTAIVYTVEEETVPNGYDFKADLANADYTTDDGSKVIYKVNEYTPQKDASHSFVKVWDHTYTAVEEIPQTTTDEGESTLGTNGYGSNTKINTNTPDSITVQLIAVGIGNVGSPVTLYADTVAKDADGNWLYQWANLDNKAGGTDIVYSVIETAVNYTATGAALDYYQVGNPELSTDKTTTKITNKYDPLLTSHTVTKFWDDANDFDKKRPGSVSVQLLADDDVVLGKVFTLNADNDWTATWTGLPRYADNDLHGAEIVYSVDELSILPYESTTGDPYPLYGTVSSVTKLTNSYVPVPVNIRVNKTWSDGDAAHVGETITVKLYDTNYPNTVIRSTTLTSPYWEADFTNLPRYEGSHTIVYEVKEDAVIGYDTTYSAPADIGDNYFKITVTNTLKTYVVNYDLAGGVIGESNSTSIAPTTGVLWEQSGFTADKTGANAPTLAKHRFDGWKLNGHLITTEAYSALTAFVIETGEVDREIPFVTLVAQWTRLYTVKYDLNGGIFNNSNTIPDVTNVLFSAADFTTGKTPSRAGHAFAGWTLNGTVVTNEAYSALTAIYRGTTEADPTLDDVTLVAQWRSLYTVNYHPNGGTLTGPASVSDVEFTQSGFVSVTNPTPPTSTAGTWTFIGWYTSENAYEGYQVADATAYSTLVNGNENTLQVTLYARYNFNQGTTPPPVIITETTTAAPTTTATGSTTPPALIITFVPTIPSTFTPTVPATTAQAATVPATEPATEQYIEPTEYEEAPDNTTPLTNITFEPDSTTPVITTEEPTTTEELAESPDNTVPQATVKIATDDKVNPQTGDNTTLLLAGIFLLAASLIGIVVFKKKIAVK